MKPLIKYITLLLCGGVIIAVYTNLSAAKTAKAVMVVKKDTVFHSAIIHDDFQFSFLKDVAAKLLPVAGFFN